MTWCEVQLCVCTDRGVLSVVAMVNHGLLVAGVAGGAFRTWLVQSMCSRSPSTPDTSLLCMP